MIKKESWMDISIRQVQDAWPSVAEIIHVPHNDAEYARLVNVLDQLIDASHGDEHDPPDSLLEIVGMLIDTYERAHDPELNKRYPL